MWIMSNILAVVVISVILCRTNGQDDAVETCKTYKGCLPPSICDDREGYISCLCPDGKTGANCDLDDPCVKRIDNCEPDQLCYGTCLPNVLCVGVTGVQMCLGCLPGWEGENCSKDIDECTNPLECNKGTCKNIPGGFKCACSKGWTGTQCQCEKGSSCDLQQQTGNKTTGSDPDSSAVTSSYNTVVLCSSIFLILLSTK